MRVVCQKGAGRCGAATQCTERRDKLVSSSGITVSGSNDRVEWCRAMLVLSNPAGFLRRHKKRPATTACRGGALNWAVARGPAVLVVTGASCRTKKNRKTQKNARAFTAEQQQHAQTTPPTQIMSVHKRDQNKMTAPPPGGVDDGRGS